MENKNLTFKTAFKTILKQKSSSSTEETTGKSCCTISKVSSLSEKLQSNLTLDVKSSDEENPKDFPNLQTFFYPKDDKGAFLEEPGNAACADFKFYGSLKLFVSNLNPITTEETTELYFKKFGQIRTCNILLDSNHTSRCFGYVLFTHATSIAKVFSSAPHIVDDVTITLSVPDWNGNDPEKFCKIFVGNLSVQTKEVDVINYFRQWGKVRHYMIKPQNEGYICFLTFTRAEGTNYVLLCQPHLIDNNEIKICYAMELIEEPDHLRKITLKYLRPETTELDLIKYFKQFGEVEAAVILRERKSRVSRRCGYVLFERAYAKSALEWSAGSEINCPGVIDFSNKTYSEPEHTRKLFIDHLSPETTEDLVIYYFEQYGHITSCVIKRDPFTRKSKGYGYVIFATKDMLYQATMTKNHMIDHAEVTLHILEKGEKLHYCDDVENEPSSGISFISRGAAGDEFLKMFVDNLSYETSEGDVTEYFERWGDVVECFIVRYPGTGKSKGFGYVTLKHANKDAVMDYKCHKLHGKKLKLKEKEISEKTKAYLMRKYKAKKTLSIPKVIAAENVPDRSDPVDPPEKWGFEDPIIWKF